MSNTLFSIRKPSALFIIPFLLICSNAFSQMKNKDQLILEDDPNLDQIPEWYLKQTAKSTKAPSTVITIDDYDNYYLGVDFAESHISVNPLDPTQFFTAYNIDETHRTQDGHDWNDATSVSWGTTIRGDVLTAYDGSGNLYYENMYGSSILGCKIVRSSNNGLSWSSPVTAISGGDKNWLAADQTSGPYANYVYTTMTNSSYNGGNFSRSTNLGNTWTTTFTPSTQSLPGMMVCVGANGSTDGGSVYVVTNSGSAFASTYTFYRSLNGGASFSYRSAQSFAGYVGTNVNGRNSVENMRTRPYPFIAADNSNGPYRGRLYLVYASNWPAGNGNKPDIWCRYSTNGGLTWSSAVKINDDASTQNNHQWAPAIWCDLTTGRLYVHWMDTRDDTSGDDEAFIYASYSDNGGVSFEPNQKISNEAMVINCTTCGGGGTPRYQGDYTSIVSNPKVSMSSWPDFRWGSFASFTAYFPDYAMRLTPVKSPDGVNTVQAEVPGVKLYTDDVIFTATMETPPSGSFSISYPGGNTLSAFPGSIPIEITDNGVPSGIYTITVTGKGPNGTPVHIRETTISVVELAPPVADFEASNTNPFINEQVNFTDLSTNAPTTWSWSFNPSTVNYLNGTGSSSENPQVEFLAPGLYSVTLVATNVYGSDSEIKSNYINVTNCTYCDAYGNNATEEWISNVSFNTINNSVNTTAGYEDFTSISTDVMPGNTYNASVSCGSSGSWTEHYWIFIDWNQDCNLAGTGEAYDLGQANGSNTLTQNITVPVGATPGATRMRVIIKYNGNPTACETGFSYGQVEDYTINVLTTDISLGLTALLEGPFNGVNMDASLGLLIPLNQPFNIPPWNYNGGESVGSVPTNVVDWVLVDLRDASTAASATPAASIGKQAAFILTNGSIVDMDGSSDLIFSVTVSQNLYAAVWQRNHIGIMSNNAIVPSGSQYNYNFTTGINQVYGGINGHKQLVPGKWGMFSGDGTADGMVNASDKSTLWENQAGTNGYIPSDYNLDSESNNIDKDEYWVPNIGKGTQVPN